MTTLPASNLTLEQINDLFGFQESQFSDEFTSLLSLEALMEDELEDLARIRNTMRRYLAYGKIYEGQVKFLSVAPLLRLAGYYEPPIRLTLEENIDRIHIQSEDLEITGRIDILAAKRSPGMEKKLYVLVIECKDSEAAPSVGYAQLIAYAFKGLEQQESVWGVATNGMTYQFLYICRGHPSSYYFMPLLNLLEVNPSIQLLQVLKAIRDCQ